MIYVCPRKDAAVTKVCANCDCGMVIEPASTPQVSEEMVERAIDALVYRGYDDETQKKVIHRQANCREYVRRSLEAALSVPPAQGDGTK